MTSCRRERILDAAERLIRHYGPNKTSVSDIAKEAAVAVGSVYLEFDGKDAILGELSGKRFEAILHAMRAAASATPDPAARLVAVLRARTHAFVEHAAEGTHGADFIHCGCAGIQTAFGAYLEAEADLLRALLRDGMSGGGLCVRDVDGTVEAVRLAWKGLTPPALWKVPADRVDALAEALGALLVDGLRARSNSVA